MQGQCLKLLTTIVILIPLAGCINADPAGHAEINEPPSNPEKTGETPPNTEPGPEDAPPSPIRLNETLVLEDCDYWWATLSLPQGANPGRPPPGFSEPDNPLVTSISLLRFDCTRIAFQDLDRGPLEMVLEAHNNVRSREECRVRVNGMSYKVAQTLLVSDSELVSRFQGIGLNAYEANITELTPLQDQPEIIIDEWGAIGESMSQFTIPRDSVLNQFQGPPIRFFWHDGDALWTADVELSGPVSAAIQRPALGSVAAPLMMAQVAPELTLDVLWTEGGGATMKIQKHPSGTCDS